MSVVDNISTNIMDQSLKLPDALQGKRILRSLMGSDLSKWKCRVRCRIGVRKELLLEECSLS